MKRRTTKWIATVAIVLTAWGARAETQSLVDSEAMWWFSAKPEFVFSEVGGEFGAWLGLTAGPQIGRAFYMGASWYGLLNNINPGQAHIDALDFWYAGLSLDYTFLADRLVHGGVGLLLGGGTATEKSGEDAGLFVAVPGISLLINITPRIELGLGAGWRFVAGANNDVLRNGDLDGFWGSLFLRWNER